MRLDAETTTHYSSRKEKLSFVPEELVPLKRRAATYATYR